MHQWLSLAVFKAVSACAFNLSRAIVAQSAGLLMKRRRILHSPFSVRRNPFPDRVFVVSQAHGPRIFPDEKLKI
jgi:hypothetical protein